MTSHFRFLMAPCYCIPASTIDELSFKSQYTERYAKVNFLKSFSYCSVESPLKCSHVCKLVFHKYEFVKQSISFGSLHLQNMMACVLLDSLMGMVVLYYLVKREAISESTVHVWTRYAEVSAVRLEAMIDFMTNTPIGLKLNLPLANFLAQLFMYHLYVWVTWVNLLRPVLPFLMLLSCLSLVFGFTVFVALLSDLMQIMTLHLYCFYLYAVRLYSCTWQTIRTLSLLFRAKKFNPLRQRVDTYHYETDQFLLGSLLFAISVFLFPTIILFYAVFSVIQFCFATFKFISLQIATAIVYQPYMSLLFQLHNSDSFFVSVYIVPCPVEKFKFKRKPASLSHLLRIFQQTLPPHWYQTSTCATLLKWIKDVAGGVAIDF